MLVWFPKGFRAKPILQPESHDAVIQPSPTLTLTAKESRNGEQYYLANIVYFRHSHYSCQAGPWFCDDEDVIRAASQKLSRRRVVIMHYVRSSVSGYQRIPKAMPTAPIKLPPSLLAQADKSGLPKGFQAKLKKEMLRFLTGKSFRVNDFVNHWNHNFSIKLASSTDSGQRISMLF